MIRNSWSLILTRSVACWLTSLQEIGGSVLAGVRQDASRVAKRGITVVRRSGLLRSPKDGISRRDLLSISAGVLAMPCVSRVVAAAPAAKDVESHGISAFGDLKY